MDTVSVRRAFLQVVGSAFDPKESGGSLDVDSEHSDHYLRCGMPKRSESALLLAWDSFLAWVLDSPAS